MNLMEFAPPFLPKLKKQHMAGSGQYFSDSGIWP